MQKINVVGSSNTDMVVKTERFPLPGETIIGGEFFHFAGGKGANQAVAAARLGGQVRFVTRVGNDSFGRQAIAGFEREGIDCSAISIDPKLASGTALITVNAAGENSIVVAPGANAALSPDLVRKLPEIKDQLVLTQLETPLATVIELVELTPYLVLNPAPARALPEQLYQRLYYLTPNETEVELLTGIKIQGEGSARRAAEVLNGKGVAHVVITLGAAGAFYRSDRQSFFVEAPRVKAVDTTAAGDVFNGALLFGLANGKDHRPAVELAVRAASLSVMHMGAQASAPSLQEVEAMFG